MRHDIIVDSQIIYPKEFPLLSVLTSFKKKPVKTNWFFNVEDMDELLIERMEGFFKKRTIKEALRDHFGITSSKINEYFNKEIIEETEDYWLLNLNYYLVLDVLKAVFLDQKKPNHDGFLKVLQSRSAIAILAPCYNHISQISTFFNDNFQENQKVETILNSKFDCELRDTAMMYSTFPDHFKETLSKLPFARKNDIRKCHDVFSAEHSKLKQINFELKQENFYPEILKLANEKTLHGEYFQIPKNFHELIEWGTILGHCIGSIYYAEKASKGSSLLLGVYNKKNEIKYTLEISDKSLIQIQGIANTKPDTRLMKNLLDLLIKYNLIRKKA